MKTTIFNENIGTYLYNYRGNNKITNKVILKYNAIIIFILHNIILYKYLGMSNLKYFFLIYEDLIHVINNNYH